jgi:hypothetical protein
MWSSSSRSRRPWASAETSRPTRARTTGLRSSVFAHWKGWAVVIVLALTIALVGGRVIGGTFASNFSGGTDYPTDNFSTPTLTAPASVAANPVGTDSTITWSATKQTTAETLAIGEYDTETSTTCSSSVGTFVALTPPSLTAGTDTVAVPSTIGAITVAAGDNICYQVETVDQSWTAPAYISTTSGLYLESMVIANGGGTAKSIGTNDTITMIFNQAVSTTSAAKNLCTVSNEIIIGDTSGSTTCATTNASSIGVLSPGITLSNEGRYANDLSYTGSGTTASPLVIKITGAPTPATSYTATPSWTFAPSSTLASSATPAATVCTVTVHTSCLPVPTGGF